MSVNMPSVPLFALGNVESISRRLRKWGISGETIFRKTVADVGSGMSDFPEQLMSMGAQRVFAVDPIYSDRDIFDHKKTQTRAAVERVLGSKKSGVVEKSNAKAMMGLLDTVDQRFLDTLSRTEPRITNLSSHHDLPDASQDIIFLNNMLKAIPDEQIGVFIDELLAKISFGGCIYISEYASTRFCDGFALQNSDRVVHLSDDDDEDPHEYYRIRKVSV